MARRNPYRSPLYGTPRTKKPRSAVTVTEKEAKRPGKCAGCSGRIQKGDKITVVRHRLKRYHTGTCVPANVGQQPGPAQAGPPKLPNTPMEATLAALLALENALVVKVKAAGGTTPEVKKAFEKYQKLKNLGLRPQTAGEGAVAMRMALLEITKIVF